MIWLFCFWQVRDIREHSGCLQYRVQFEGSERCEWVGRDRVLGVCQFDVSDWMPRIQLERCDSVSRSASVPKKILKRRSECEDGVLKKRVKKVSFEDEAVNGLWSVCYFDVLCVWKGEMMIRC